MKFTQRIRKQCESLIITIPSVVVGQMELKEEQYIEVEVKKRGVKR